MSEAKGPARRRGPRPKHVPIRTCVVCREKEAKRQFVRIVRTPEGTVEIDRTGKKNGRGAYLCTRFACWERAASGNALDRALRTELSEETRAALRKYADEHFRREDDEA
ncbi:MAG: YlxR family protein [Thermomicrobiaceae bacterium]|nr:YlxR family protein [Thermomicrobiaceae bacterium]